MRTFTIEEAADFLKMKPQTVRRKAAAGEIPGAKAGKKWCFVDEDLVGYLRSLYANSAYKASQGVNSFRREELCHSVNEVIRGGFALATMEKEYKEALGL